MCTEFHTNIFLYVSKISDPNLGGAVEPPTQPCTSFGPVLMVVDYDQCANFQEFFSMLRATKAPETLTKKNNRDIPMENHRAFILSGFGAL